MAFTSRKWEPNDTFPWCKAMETPRRPMGHTERLPKLPGTLASADEFRNSSTRLWLLWREPCFRASLICDGLSQDTRELPTPYQWQMPFQSGQEWVPGSGPCPWGWGWELLCVLAQPITEEAYPKIRCWIRTQRPPKQSSQ